MSDRPGRPYDTCRREQRDPARPSATAMRGSGTIATPVESSVPPKASRRRGWGCSAGRPAESRKEGQERATRGAHVASNGRSGTAAGRRCQRIRARTARRWGRRRRAVPLRLSLMFASVCGISVSFLDFIAPKVVKNRFFRHGRSSLHDRLEKPLPGDALFALESQHLVSMFAVTSGVQKKYGHMRTCLKRGPHLSKLDLR